MSSNLPPHLRPGIQRAGPSFLTRAARDDAAQLDERPSIPQNAPAGRQGATSPKEQGISNQRALHFDGEGHQGLGKPVKPSFGGDHDGPHQPGVQPSRGQSETDPLLLKGDGATHKASTPSAHATNGAWSGYKDKATLNTSGGDSKLSTFSGVFVPTSLNVLSILMFLRFGFILGQSGVVGMIGMLVICYLIDLVTTLSISAIATNGTVRGGGAYYLISRSLGPEFGGSIGVVFYLGFVFNTGMNAVGLVDCLMQSFGDVSGTWSNWLPEGFWWNYLWATTILVVCTLICLAGSSVFSRASNGLLAIVLISTLSIPFSALVMKPFESRRLGIQFTGPAADTFKGNLMPRFTRGADGSGLDGKENFQDLFGILFPATGGIFAGASMSGDLKNPSRSIPKGTLGGLALTFALYVVVILSMAATITRASFYRNVNVIQETNVSGLLILLGEFATSFFSSLMGVIGSAKLLQALARDSVLPGISIFGRGSKKNDEPTLAIIFTYLVAQATMLFDINKIASLITMTYLMTFLVTNLACFLLKISSAPNFRPSFHYFNWETAAAGTVVSGITMFFVDGLYATGSVGVLLMLFLLIHYTTPPKSWGDVSQSLIYHQVRKYLLRLRQEHVKYWRPQILLFINDPQSQYKLVHFCNHLKKGALYVLGHVIVSDDFDTQVQEARRQQTAWTKFVDVVKVKAFVNIVVAPTVEWGARNIVMSSGLGGMRPNIAVLGFYDLQKAKESENAEGQDKTALYATGPDAIGRLSAEGESTVHTAASQRPLPTDTCRVESAMTAASYVTILEDLLTKLRINVAIARGFRNLEFPTSDKSNSKRYIDLWPIQMSAEIISEGADNANVLTTNFDTYTLILQLGCILNTVPAWKKSFKLRVAVFVEYESDVEEERERVMSLLDKLRIQAEVLVFWLASGELRFYEIFVNGLRPSESDRHRLNDVDPLRDGRNWHDTDELASTADQVAALARVDSAPANGGGDETAFALVVESPLSTDTTRQRHLTSLGEFISRKRRHTMSGLSMLQVNLGMRTHRLSSALIDDHGSPASSSEDESDDDTESDPWNRGGGDVVVDEDDDEDDSHHATDSYFTPRRTAETLPPRPSFFSSRPEGRRGGGGGDGKVHLPPRTISAPQGLPQTTTMASTAAAFNPRSLGGNRVLSLNRTTSGPPATRPLAGIRRSAENMRSSATAAAASSASSAAATKRPILAQHASGAKFTCLPVPPTQVAPTETSGPSIMFAETPPPHSSGPPPPPGARRPGSAAGKHHEPHDHHSHPQEHQQHQHQQHQPQQHPQAPSIPSRSNAGTPPPPQPLSSPSSSTRASTSASARASASGFPLPRAQPLSFNDLPCRPQHLILNELMRRQSQRTAVVLTTLPSPVRGTCLSEADSSRYLSDLDLLCQELPPTLLVHSNSMTVTMNL